MIVVRCCSSSGVTCNHSISVELRNLYRGSSMWPSTTMAQPLADSLALRMAVVVELHTSSREKVGTYCRARALISRSRRGGSTDQESATAARNSHVSRQPAGTPNPVLQPRNCAMVCKSSNRAHQRLRAPSACRPNREAVPRRVSGASAVWRRNSLSSLREQGSISSASVSNGHVTTLLELVWLTHKTWTR